MKLTLIALFAFAFSASLFAQEKSTGCGLGWQVTKSMTTSAASTRASTNATSSNTFAMTSGTSGCEKHSIVKAKSFEQHFIEANHESIALDLATGGGEFSSAWAKIHGCTEKDEATFNSFAKRYIQRMMNIKGNEVVPFLNEFNHSFSQDMKIKLACSPVV